MKLRSWNETDQEFIYFENGVCYYLENGHRDYLKAEGFFDWQYVEMGIKVKEFEFFVGDKIDVDYTDIYGHKHNICGIVSFENYEVYINEAVSRYYSLNDILNATKIIVISNIHEN